jgi:competence protein ComGC
MEPFKIRRSQRANHRAAAFTLIELMMIVVGLAVLVLLCISGLPRARHRARLNQCEKNLKQIGLAFRISSLDSNDSYAFGRPAASGGSLEAIATGETFRHFQVMSNDLQDCRILVCPLDDRKRATNFGHDFSNTNLSYFVGIDANDTNPNMFLSGDRNLTNGLVLTNNIMILTTNRAFGWTSAMHDRCGNILFSDGSMQHLNNSQLEKALAGTGSVTNRLQMP